ncbi:MAG: radical SAM protein [Ignavibacteria bacterium]|nr:radical SAM protein [Ignavibacteria bacterium]
MSDSYLKNCDICPHKCNVNRIAGELGICKSTHKIRISSYFAHFGEEPELVGRYGSGTIFFSGCNLLCIFCQNYDISHFNQGYEISTEKLSDIMFELEDNGCHNINLVTPTHYTFQISEAIEIAKGRGLEIPVVWNSNAYERVETLKKLRGLVDIYMPDLKFYRNSISEILTTANNYFEFASLAIIEMHKQVGDLVIENGIAKKGIMIRHLIMPENFSDSIEIINFIAKNLGNNTYLNLMAQYYPSYKSYTIKEINRRIHTSEYYKCVDYARSLGFKRPDYIY